MVFYFKYIIFFIFCSSSLLSFFTAPVCKAPMTRLFFLLQRYFFLQKWANFSPIPNTHPELRLYFKKQDRWQEDLFFRDRAVNFIVRYRLAKMQVAMATHGEFATQSLCLFLRSRNFKANEPVQFRIDVLTYKCYPLEQKIGHSRYTLASRRI